MFSFKGNQDFILFVGIFLVVLLSFACGFIVAKKQEKESIKIYKYERTKSSYCWSWNLRSLFS